MEWEQEIVEKGFSLYLELSKKGYVTDKQGEFVQWYENRHVEEFIRKVIEPKGKVMIFMDEETRTLQMVPDIENETISFTNEELKKELRFQDNKDVHLFYFILYLLINELSQSQDRELAKRLYMPMEELLEKLDQYIDKYRMLGNEKLEKISDKYQVDVIGIVNAWDRMSVFKEGAINHVQTKENHRMYIERSLRFLENEKLVKIKGKNEITVTNKMENIISHYYHQITSKNKIHQLLHVDLEMDNVEGGE
ncbi:DUF6063 family protein [Gottfriedia sp. NPDC057991]|uniref:DUF6063 family protein n=1 Tax=Gottfriedia sp. NPDC057991 TaxID=3346298 RepID=UPI0036DB572B